MRLNEDFESTHDLAAWALAYELGDSAVQDRGIVDELSALLQTPVANPGFFCSNLFKNCIGRICYGSAQEWSKRLDAACEFAYRFFFRQGRTVMPVRQEKESDKPAHKWHHAFLATN